MLKLSLIVAKLQDIFAMRDKTFQLSNVQLCRHSPHMATGSLNVATSTISQIQYSLLSS
jgi:hypothetical protein